MSRAKSYFFGFRSGGKGQPRVRFETYSPWRNRLGRLLLYLAWFTKSGREAIREVRRLEKALKERDKGDKTAMEKLWREDLARAEASGKPLDRARALSQLGMELMNQKQFGDAERLLRQSQEIARQEEGPAGFWSLGASNHLGWMSQKLGREADAEAHFLEALHIAEKELGPEHHRVAFELLGLANFYHWQGRRADEIAAVERLLAIDEKLTNDPQTADVARSMILTSHYRLAALYAKEGRDAEAEGLYRRVIDQFAEMKMKGPQAEILGPALLAGTYHGYAKLLRKRGQNDMAAQCENQFEKLMKKIDPKGLLPRDWMDKER
jgi:tetratricopeptide (TPR) repeat protein